jgi:hypothetical protein
MTSSSTRRLAVFVLLAVLAFTLNGCWNPFAPDPVPPKPVEPADYHVRLTPEDVLHNLKTAYVWRNAGEYLDCLSEDFEFYPNEADVQDPTLDIPPIWYKPDEQNMHDNMFSDGSNVESITLTLTISSLVYDYGIPEDPLDDTCVCQVEVDLRVNLIVGVTYLATAPSQFDMRRDVDQWGPEDELLWEIYAWYDLGNPGPGRGGAARDPEVDLVSLSELKSLFMQ